MTAFLLGLSNGGACLAYCAPVLVPYLLGATPGVGAATFLMARFLAGRLLGYLLFGLLAWAVGRPLLEADGSRGLLTGGAYLLFALLMIRFGLGRAAADCPAGRLAGLMERGPSFLRRFMPELLGLATGINLCPPFLLAFTAAAATGTLARSLLFFIAFFGGTALFFIPFPFIGMFGKYPAVQATGKMAAVIMGLYYLYGGIIMIAGGFTAP